MSPPPPTLEGFERFVAWAQSQRAAGTYMCFAVTLKGFDTPIGLFQIHRFEGNPGTAEWGFAIGSSFWGSGVFQQGAELVIDFAFNVLKVNRLEARTALCNGRGLRALKKIGGRGLLALTFAEIRVPGDEAPITAAWRQEGKSETAKDAATIAAGAAVGAVAGNQAKDNDKGKVIGGLIDAGIGTLIASKTGGEPVELPAGSHLTLTLREPVEVRITS